MADLTMNVASSASPVVFASFTVRARALVTDMLVQGTSFVIIMLLASAAESVPSSGRIAFAAVVALLALYEPLQVARFGATVGHRWANIRVVRTATGDRPGLGRSSLRWFLKTILGLPSFLLMAFTSRHQALHDAITGTVVTITDASKARAVDAIAEREPEAANTRAPAWKRIAVSLGFLLLAIIVLLVVEILLVSSDCLKGGTCSGVEAALVDTIGLLFVLAVFAIPMLGWFGKLPGARNAAGTISTPSNEEL